MKQARRTKKFFSAVLFFFFLGTTKIKTELLQGDAGAGAAETFTFAVKDYGVSSDGAAVYVAAHPDPLVAADTNNYAVCAIRRNETKFIPLTPELAIIDGGETANPLFNNKISFLKMLGTYPFVVPVNDLTSIYLFDRLSIQKDEQTGCTIEKAVLIALENIKDVAFAVTSGIQQVESADSTIFAAVAPNGGSFGDANSGIATILYGKFKEQDGDEQVIKTKLSQQAATAFTRTTAALKITTDLASLSVKDMHWDSMLKRLYIACDVTGGAGASDGARAVVVGALTTAGTFVFYPIAPDAAFTGDDEIVGGVGANTQVAINKISTMPTSTWLSYLIVLGGNSSIDQDKNVFALPLVNDATDVATAGTLAKKDADVENTFCNDNAGTIALSGRIMSDAATTNADLLKDTSEAAKVGGGPTDDDIVDMFVHRDSVFVVVDASYAANQPKRRVLFSRALFDQKGRIIKWTAWRPVYAADSKVFGAAIDKSNGNLITIENDSPNNNATDSRNAKSVRRTQWGRGNGEGLGDLVSLLSAEFPHQQGGIHGWSDFHEDTLGLTNVSIALVTGRKKVAFVQTASGSPAIVEKGTFSANTLSFTDGTVTQNLGGSTKVVVIEGGQLNNIGPIEVATVAYESTGDTTRLFVGGVGGLAALVNADGSGISGKLQAGFSGIVSGMAFKKIGNYSFVRKLHADSNFLYVLTDTQLDRISLTGNSFTAVTLANSNKFVGVDGAFLDVHVSDKFCVLATSKGIYRTGNGKDISSAISSDDVSWTQVTVPDNSGAVQNLLSVTPLGRNLSGGGNLNVVTSNQGKDRAKLNRFYVAVPSAVDDDSILPLEDYYTTTQDGTPIPSYLLSYGTFRNIVSTDGAYHFSTKERDCSADPFVRLLSSYVRPGLGVLLQIGQEVSLPISSFSELVQLERSNGGGSLFLASDQGLLVNE